MVTLGQPGDVPGDCGRITGSLANLLTNRREGDLAPPLEEKMEIRSGSLSVGTVDEPAAPTLKPKRHRVVIKAPEKRQLVQSKVGFPYMDLETGISVAQSMLEAGGVALTREQLAGVMKMPVGGGTFITKTATARIFGLIATVQGKYELTNLGFDIISNDENKQQAARAEAFLTVPLYKRTYEEFKGKQLPPKTGLENAFAKFGVPPKQVYNARLAFEKSANQAGFFPAGPDRLIEPILRGPTGPTGPSNSSGSPTGPTGPAGGLYERMSADLPTRPRYTGANEVGLDLDQLIVGLLRRLPKPGEKWEAEKRARWLQTLAANFDMVYQTEDGDKTVFIECKNYKQQND
jgi:hypothetical protein